jgi:dGTPase
MVLDVVKVTENNLRKFNIKKPNDVYKLNSFIVDFSSKMKKEVEQIKAFLSSNMYNNKLVIKKTNNGKKIINYLFNYLKKYPKRFINHELLLSYDKERVISDFIAGMTDRFAIKLYNKIK